MKATCILCAWCLPSYPSMEHNAAWPLGFECWNKEPGTYECFPFSAHMCYAFCPTACMPAKVWSKIAETWEERYGCISPIG